MELFLWPNANEAVEGSPLHHSTQREITSVEAFGEPIVLKACTQKGKRNANVKSF